MKPHELQQLHQRGAAGHRLGGPGIDPAVPAFYYVRVLQIPTPRHFKFYDAVALQIPPPQKLPTTIQERAYSSPIWYTP